MPKTPMRKYLAGLSLLACLFGASASATEPATEAAPTDKVSNADARTAEYVRGIVNYYGSRVNNAYQRALRDNPPFGGTIKISLHIAADGRCTSVDIISAQPDFPHDFLNALTRTIKGINFGPASQDFVGSHTFNFYPN